MAAAAAADISGSLAVAAGSQLQEGGQATATATGSPLYALPLPLPLVDPAICFCRLLGTHTGWFSKNSLCRALTACEACWLLMIREMLTCGATQQRVEGEGTGSSK